MNALFKCQKQTIFLWRDTSHVATLIRIHRDEEDDDADDDAADSLLN